jgi:hypothetical protein
MSFQKATRELRIPKILLSGVSGGGKTLSAIKVMRGLIGDKSFGIIDAESRSSAIYAKDYDFMMCDLVDSEQNINGYIKAMEDAKSVIKGLIVDGITPAWKDILDKSSRMEGSSYQNWGKLTPLQDKFMKYIVSYPLPLVCTVRSKQGYVLELNDKGKQVPKKVGLEIEQRNSSDYEFDIHISIDQSTHKGKIEKCRYSEVEDYFNQNGGEVLLTEEVGVIIKKAIKGE